MRLSKQLTALALSAMICITGCGSFSEEATDLSDTVSETINKEFSPADINLSVSGTAVKSTGGRKSAK